MLIFSYVNLSVQICLATRKVLELKCVIVLYTIEVVLLSNIIRLKNHTKATRPFCPYPLQNVEKKIQNYREDPASAHA
jgi:hypothetical protein